MKTNWDYTMLADAYLKRPDYSEAAINAMLAIAGVSGGEKVCDVGAGVAHLTLMLAAKGMKVVAVEPNDAMRANGMKRTSHMDHVSWQEGTGEQTGQKNKAFSMVTFGSSFNVCDRPKALEEAARILVPRGWFACMWNHRSLVDPIQEKIESIIKSYISNYGYGTRREDQTSVIENNRLFGPVIHLEAKVVHEQTTGACLEAWRSHATLERQASKKFEEIIMGIGNYLNSLKRDSIKIPYTTQIWMAQLAR